MGQTWSLGSIPKACYTNDDETRYSTYGIDNDKGGNLKLAAQKVTGFNGYNDEWRKWKNKTACTFKGSSYDKILYDEDFAKTHPRMNKIVYSQLAAATIDGTANHLVTKHADTKNGHAAWNSLVNWFDGDVIQEETAEELRSKLNGLLLLPGMSASSYINK